MVAPALVLLRRSEPDKADAHAWARPLESAQTEYAARIVPRAPDLRHVILTADVQRLVLHRAVSAAFRRMAIAVRLRSMARSGPSPPEVP
jgi:hypothetical protein